MPYIDSFLGWICNTEISFKKTWNFFKKPIDFFIYMLYNITSAKQGTALLAQNCSLKIEQHEISSTEKCRDLVNTLWKKKLIK